MRKIEKLVQEDFKMKIIKDLGMLPTKGSSDRVVRFAIFECDKCKTQYTTAVSDAKRKKSPYCKACSRIGLAKTHGYSKTRIYKLFTNLKQRCYNKKHKTYCEYGEMGITVCKEWKNSHENFIKWSYENGYNDSLTIDRIDSTKGYSPDNCRWVSLNVQNQNRRKPKNNTSGYKGVSYKSSLSKFRTIINVNKKQKELMFSKCRLECAYAYDDYIVKNNLVHPTNFPRPV